jgi:hypothetical protein
LDKLLKQESRIEGGSEALQAEVRDSVFHRFATVKTLRNRN